ncbi:flagellar hook-length control protein FliK [Fontimonas sp. SYSU GA230001]|uniref:flagellar hook-length control protein FliK n=1 Tax=Fontimonas sp. SYSU GA230001 TaxID=3142450 RepID=UPI0032B45F2E
MAGTSAVPASAGAAARIGSTPRAEAVPGAAPGDFAGLFGALTLASAVPGEPVVAEPVAEGEMPQTDADGAAEDAGAASALLGWLFGLMPAAAEPDAAATPVDAVPGAVGEVVPFSAAAGALAVADDADLVPALRAAVPARDRAAIPGMSLSAAEPSGRTDARPGTGPALFAPELQTAAADLVPPASVRDAADPLHALAALRAAHDPAVPVTLPAFGHAAAAHSPIAAGPAGPPPAAPLHALAPEFVADLGERIEWQLADGVGEARIELHPAELGSLTVRIETQGDQARIHIAAAEAATRSLLSHALPQLRELFASAGINLTRGQVDTLERRDRLVGERAGSAAAVVAGQRRRITQVLLVDAYA